MNNTLETYRTATHSRRTTALNQFFLVVPALVAFAVICWRFLFVQDDAYISYRFVANALSGHGLVYNAGEQIEGFTNFGWVILLLLAGELGADLPLTSALIGFLCGLGIIIVTWLISRRLFAETLKWYAFIPVYLVAANGALAFWSPAGLETACFALLTMLSVYFFLTRNWLLVWSLALAVWMRPEGAVVAALLVLIEAIVHKRIPRFAVLCTAIASLLSLPMVGFKVWYYGSVLPNPFYAKTSFDLIQLKHGLEYSGLFFLHYGFLGLSLLFPLLYIRRLDYWQKTLWLFMLGYSSYVVLIGGDVLKVHRFFLPIMGICALLATVSIGLLLTNIAAKFQRPIAISTFLILLAATWFVPLPHIRDYLSMERALTDKMLTTGRKLLEQDSTAFSLATSTIGAIGYTLLGHRVIDMVGLTDSAVARHPQADIVGISSTWKEQKFNATYVLREAPDYILFATGVKPSSPADQALFLYTPFLESYRSRTLIYANLPGVEGRRPLIVYYRLRPVRKPAKPDIPASFVTSLKYGSELASAGKFAEALAQYAKAERDLGQVFYSELAYRQAFALTFIGRYEEAYDLLNTILERDSFVAGPHRDLYIAETVNGNLAKAAIHLDFLRLLSPGDIPETDSLLINM